MHYSMLLKTLLYGSTHVRVTIFFSRIAFSCSCKKIKHKIRTRIHKPITNGQVSLLKEETEHPNSNVSDIGRETYIPSSKYKEGNNNYFISTNIPVI